MADGVELRHSAHLVNPDGEFTVGVNTDNQIVFEGEVIRIPERPYAPALLGVVLEYKNRPITPREIWKNHADAFRNPGAAPRKNETQFLYVQLRYLREDSPVPQINRHFFSLGNRGVSASLIFVENITDASAGVSALQAYHEQNPSKVTERYIEQYANYFKEQESSGEALPHEEQNRYAEKAASLTTDLLTKQERSAYHDAMRLIGQLRPHDEGLTGYDVLVVAEIIASGRSLLAIEIEQRLAQKLGKHINMDRVAQALWGLYNRPFVSNHYRGTVFERSVRKDGGKEVRVAWRTIPQVDG